MKILAAQSGGPTAVINASLAGIVGRARELGHEVLGGLYGVEGILRGEFTRLPKSKKDLERISRTPGAYLGSCRHILPEPPDAVYDRLFGIFEENGIDAFLYIGGNDSMDSVKKISFEAARRKIPLLVGGVPKTIDNDLAETDHCPGYPSAAKFLNVVASEFVMDSISYSNPPICVVEAMGRDTGWLAASLKFSERLVKGLKVLSYVPEVPTSDAEILDEVAKAGNGGGPVLVAVSEGVLDRDGNYLKSSPVTDSFGHPKLGGVGEHVTSLLESVGKVKFINAGFAQRAASHLTSEVDFEEAKMVGSSSVDAVDEGKTGFFAGLSRREKDYLSAVNFVSIEKVANKVRHVPAELLENNMERFPEYIGPLLGVIDHFAVRD